MMELSSNDVSTHEKASRGVNEKTWRITPTVSVFLKPTFFHPNFDFGSWSADVISQSECNLSQSRARGVNDIGLRGEEKLSGVPRWMRDAPSSGKT